jgi:polyisoprenyl-phosphate glycosyltransferase
MRKKPFISVVIPVYGCAACLYELHRRLTAVLQPHVKTYEFIFVDDRSTDGCWEIIQELRKQDPRHVAGIRFSQNSGQHKAIGYGVLCARGKKIAVMDCDLQDRPEELWLLLEASSKTPGLVIAKRIHRRYSLPKMMAVRLFHVLFSLIAGRKSDPDYGNFSIIDRSFIPELKKSPLFGISYIQALLSLPVPFVRVDVRHGQRYAGVSMYTIPGLFVYAFRCLLAQTFRKNKWNDILPRVTDRLGI